MMEVVIAFCVFLIVWVIWWASADDICRALRANRKISMTLPDCCDGDKETMLWNAWELLADASDEQGKEWNKKFAAWEQEYFGCDGEGCE